MGKRLQIGVKKVIGNQPNGISWDLTNKMKSGRWSFGPDLTVAVVVGVWTICALCERR